MRVRVSISISPQTLEAVDKLAGTKSNRSRIFETAVLAYLDRKHRKGREDRDLEILNRCADDLNQEIEDILAYQPALRCGSGRP